MAHIHRITSVRLFFIPIQTRVPLKFGPETLTSVTCARVALRVADDHGREAEGWGETPLSVQWVWPCSIPYEERHATLKHFTQQLVSAWMSFRQTGHPLEVGHEFQAHVLPQFLADFNAKARSLSDPNLQRFNASTLQRSNAPTPQQPSAPMPWLAALVCNSAFDLALHDAYGQLLGRPIYETYGPDFLQSDLSRFLEPAAGSSVSFRARYPSDYLVARPPQKLPAWHLVAGLDLLEPADLTGAEPKDGHPVVLTDWIHRDGLKCLKVKLRGNDAGWDYDRLVRVGQIAQATRADCLSADFNCTVQEPAYVNQILDRLRSEHPQMFDRLLYVEQPFPYELESHRIDVHAVSTRKPLFLDESAHDWRMIRLGRDLGWTGVALKTCKTQTGAILSACWAKAHGLSLMVQDLSNPMLAQIPHVLLAAHVGTIMGVETNAMQFYPAASVPEEKVHPGLYQRRDGNIDLSTLHGPGFGYRLDEIPRQLPAPALSLTL
jgi:L-alanine-DL-glutamate epimerase-like enolase superfamily enzyme